jgi:hypothetical protein
MCWIMYICKQTARRGKRRDQGNLGRFGSGVRVAGPDQIRRARHPILLAAAAQLSSAQLQSPSPTVILFDQESPQQLCSTQMKRSLSIASLSRPSLNICAVSTLNTSASGFGKDDFRALVTAWTCTSPSCPTALPLP